MNDFDIKQLISKLTGVQLVKQAMPDVAGVKHIKNRGLQWEEFQPGTTDVAPIVSAEISNLMSEFQAKFHESSGGNSNARMIWAYVTKDASIQKSHIDAIKTSDDPRKDQFLALIEWMNKYGARLWMSPTALDRHVQDTGQAVQDSSNTSAKWLEQFGYIWGLHKKGDYRNKRQADDVSDEHAEQIKNDPKAQEGLKQTNQKLMQVVTAPMNGAYGIFFDDGHNKIPVIGTDYYASSGTHQHDRGWVDWDTFRSESGQHSKYYGITMPQPNGDVKKMLVYPTSTQFLLPEGEQDPNPQIVSKADLKSTMSEKTEYIWNNGGTETMIPNNEIAKGGRGTYVWKKPDGKVVEIPAKQLQIKESPLYYLWIKNDGTLWWVPKDMRNEVAGRERKSVKKREGAETGQPFPLTREQVDFFNMLKNKHVRVTNPHTLVYSWDTLPDNTPEEKQEKQAKIEDWKQKTRLMNQLYDFIAEHPQLPPSDVRLQATKYVIIGPQFKEGSNTGVQETIGRMKSHHTLIHDMMPGTEEHYATRKGWVVVGGEFNAARAEARGERGLQPAQSISGTGPLTQYATVYDAIDYAFKAWKINAPKPNGEELKAAQQAFDMAHGTAAAAPKPKNAIPTLTDDMVQQFGTPPQHPMPMSPTQQATPAVRPQTPAPTTPTQQVMPKQNEEFQTASQKQVMLKDASQIIRNFKRLG